MGGKGRRRREKNFKAAHGGYSRLPPPPNPSKSDALPGKLRQIMSFTSPLPDGSTKPSISAAEDNKRKRRRAHAEKDSITSEATARKADDGSDDEGGHDSGDEKKKKKRKKNQVNDLRFETLVSTKTSQKKRERRKKYLETKKNKKHKQSTTEDNLDFPGREKIQFGDVVQAPPKLLAVPKGLKKVPDASQERVRLQAIDAYRKRKGWTSRLGLQLPNLDVATSL